jgi:hypothetical protein
MAKLSSAELAKREDVIKTMKKNKRGLVKRYGSDAEKVMYGRATNIAKKVTETQMEKSNLKELVRAALMQEKAGFSKEFDSDPALKGGQKNLPDGLQKAIISKAKPANEDLDLGHEDDEPHMIKSELYRIGKYAMELYQMVDQFEGKGEVDFPAWWQAKITTAKNMVSSAKHYLEFELKEPEIDAMVSVATGEDIIPNIPSVPLEDEIEEGLPKNYWAKKIPGGKMDKSLQETNENEDILGDIISDMLKYKTKEEVLAYLKQKMSSLDESYEALVKKIKGQGKSEKAAKAIAGAVASYKAKGGGKGPTAKQKARG